MKLFDFTAVNGVPFRVRVVFKGDSYGQNFCLTHDSDDPLVEFYDKRYNFTPHGQFVTRYFAVTLTERGENGLDLYGGEPNWKVDSFSMNRVKDFLIGALQ